MLLGWMASVVTQVMLVGGYNPTSQMFSRAYPVLVSISQGGMCAHSWEMPLERFEAYSMVIVSLLYYQEDQHSVLTRKKVTYITAPVFMLCNGFTKLSLLTFYLHLSPQTWFRASVWISIVIVALYTSIITFIMFFQCSPPRKSFDFSITHGSCIDAGILYMATAVSNIITDIILFCLPIPMVYQLHMPRIQKVGAIIIFAIGSMYVGLEA
jgi:hypothetical protein